MEDILNRIRMEKAKMESTGRGSGAGGQVEIDVTDASFQKEVIDKSNELPVVVDFWAPWCGPCRMLKPILEKLAHEYNGKFLLAKVNVQENMQVASALKVTSIPAVKMFMGGKIVDEFVQSQPEHMVRKWLENHVKI